MMVNGNIGAGVAVAGAFSLVRFRSAPGSAKEMVSVFLAMGAGLICGMGYLGFAALFTVILCGAFGLYNLWAFCNQKSEAIYKTVKITIPEDLDYTGAFDDAIHANHDNILENGKSPLGNVSILGGNLTLYSNDDGVHADGMLAIHGGTVTITNAYEGLKARR